MLIAGIALASCGDDDGGEASQASTPPAPAATAPTTTGAGEVADACKLLTDAEVTQQLGNGAKRERKAGTSLDEHPFTQCRWTAGKKEIGVVVIATTARFETHSKLAGGSTVSGLGDAATVRRGTSLETRGGTGGRTVTVKDGGRTLVVALDLGGTVGVTVQSNGATATENEPVSDADVVALARVAHARLR